MSGLLIILLVWFLAGALVAVTIIWPACAIASRVRLEDANADANLAAQNLGRGEG